VVLSADTLSRGLQIVVLDLALSGDNAVVIGMAAHPLSPSYRRLALLIGGSGAVVLRLLVTALAAVLLSQPGIRLIGGVLLVWIAFRLLDQDASTHEAHSAETLRGVVLTILAADVAMSVDNVLGVAALSNGDNALLAIGLLVSMGVVMFAGGMVSRLMDRLYWLTYVGAAIIAWAGADIALGSTVFLGAGPLAIPRVAADAFIQGSRQRFILDWPVGRRYKCTAVPARTQGEEALFDHATRLDRRPGPNGGV
jgi:YjbE family integral membrane protein